MKTERRSARPTAGKAVPMILAIRALRKSKGQAPTVREISEELKKRGSYGRGKKR